MTKADAPTSETGCLETTLAAEHRSWAARFEDAGLDTPALDARLLIAAAIRAPDIVTLIQPDRRLRDDELRAIAPLMQRRLNREPVSRILGHRAFYGLDLEIGPATLDPRPDTETVVEEALRLFRAGELPGGAAPRIADLGTGSGAIMLALLHNIPGAEGVATDISPSALAAACRNATRLALSERLNAVCTNWLDGVAGPFDLIVSNPPYIQTADIAGLDPEVRSYDPRGALDGGEDGLHAYRALLPKALPKIAEGGWIILEVGVGQASAVAALAGAVFRGSLAASRTITDLSGNVRCVAIQARH